MAADRVVSQFAQTAAVSGLSLEERLERGELVHFGACPVPLPCEADRSFLLEQWLSSRGHKNISYDPNSGRLAGYRWYSEGQANHLHEVLAAFSRGAAQWLADALPRYAGAWRLDRVSFRPEEVAIRPLRLTARNDLLHIDAFPTRPTNGGRILRLFINLHPSDPRVWVTSETFAQLLERFGREIGLPEKPGLGWTWRWRLEILRLLSASPQRRSLYDAFMLRFHNFLKANDHFQERGPKRYWSFPPGSAWLLFSDGLSYADLRGQYLLEHSFVVSPRAMVCPDLAPVNLLQRICHSPVLNRVA